MTISEFFVVVIKTMMTESIIEAIRFMCHGVWYNIWPNRYAVLGSRLHLDNRYGWGMAGVESLMVLAMTYLEYRIFAIVIFVLGIMFVIDQAVFYGIRVWDSLRN